MRNGIHQARERIRELEKQLETLQKQLDQTEDKSNKMYLHMYSQGQESERLQHGLQVRILQVIRLVLNIKNSLVFSF